VRSIRSCDSAIASMTVVNTADDIDVGVLTDDPSLGAAVVSQPDNPGYGGAANIGLGHGGAPFVLVSNADIWAHEGSLDRLLWVLNSSPEYGCVGPLFLNPDGTLQDSAFAFPGVGQAVFDLLPLPKRLRGSRLNGRLWSRRNPRPVGYVLGAFMLMRRQALEAVGGFSSEYWMYAEEIDLCRRFKGAGWQVIHVPAALVTHIQAASTGPHESKFIPQLYKSRARWYRKHRAAPVAKCLVVLMWAALTVRANLPGPRREVYAAARAALALD
jgi:N-acetylglucosaminyl-diphospho-decaprenol L-rhamnosyltransferase